ncbi:MAG: DNA mismatch repair protein MutS [Gemmatimonadota bacterium]|jgi:hypothetical protein
MIPGDEESATEPRRVYREGRDRERDLAERARASSERLSVVRAAVFVGLAACLVLADPLEGAGKPLALVVGALLLAVFVHLVRRHRALRREIRHREVMASLHEAGLARLDRDWDVLEESGLPAGPDEPPGGAHPYAEDLYLFGHASLFRLLGPVTTSPGRATLAGWLTRPTSPRGIASRQEAVRALAPKLELRHRMTALGIEGPPERAGHVRPLLEWVSSPAWLEGERAVRVAALLLPPTTLALFGLYLGGTLPPLWIVPFVLQVAALRKVQGRIAQEVDRVGVGAEAVRRWAGQLALLPELPRADPLDRIRQAATVRGTPAHESLQSLRARLDFAESRGNMVYQALNFVALLDVWAYRALERWKAAHGEEVAGWVEALGEAEALMALATLAHDHPDWCLPRIGGAEGAEVPVRLKARALGHPLLAPEVRVANDVEVGPPGSFLLITGSNMSGKSTLLRAIGANVVLAQAGAPACAEEMSLPPVTLWTSMMVGDSLESGVSRFMAELLRLKAVVDAARAGQEEGRCVLYLLDEILQGTNTAERRVAARTSIRHLLDAGAIGAVTTHDLTLHQASDLERRARAFHFRESVRRVEGRPRLHFDYRLRPGLSTTTNALELLEAVGLGPVEEPAASPGARKGDAAEREGHGATPSGRDPGQEGPSGTG